MAAFTTVLLGSVISNVLNTHSQLLRSLSAEVGSTVAAVTGVDVSNSVLGLVVVATTLSFLWGVAYHYARHSTN